MTLKFVRFMLKKCQKAHFLALKAITLKLSNQYSWVLTETRKREIKEEYNKERHKKIFGFRKWENNRRYGWFLWWGQYKESKLLLKGWSKRGREKMTFWCLFWEENRTTNIKRIIKEYYNKFLYLQASNYNRLIGQSSSHSVHVRLTAP